ncbi:hypothetical protein FOZ63_012240 [Perkinsus olseni]|uniref:Uncharacterized protein n=1 Tax=Perkinsus olseni TaxID=32597 RepID=A0A7J6QWN8_PEROL|nr:hypothetical protein FOZ63_012240 [Perkinsus olseni]
MEKTVISPTNEGDNPRIIASLLSRMALLEARISEAGCSCQRGPSEAPPAARLNSVNHNSVTWRIPSFRQRMVSTDRTTLQSGPFSLLGFPFRGISIVLADEAWDASRNHQSLPSPSLPPLPGVCSIIVTGPVELSPARVTLSIGTKISKEYTNVSFSSTDCTTAGMGEAVFSSICRLEEGWDREADTFTIQLVIEEIRHTIAYSPELTTTARFSTPSDDQRAPPRCVEWRLERADLVLREGPRSISSPEFRLPGARNELFCLRLLRPELGTNSDQTGFGLHLIRCHSPSVKSQMGIEVSADLQLAGTTSSQGIRKEIEGKLERSIGLDEFCSIASATARLTGDRELVFLLTLKHLYVTDRQESFLDRDESMGRIFVSKCGLPVTHVQARPDEIPHQLQACHRQPFFPKHPLSSTTLKDEKLIVTCLHE